MKTKLRSLILPVLFLAGCQTAPPPATANQFARRNLPSFYFRTLDNGIPVVIKKNDDNRVFSLVVGLKGQAMFTPPARAGIEAIALKMIAKGSGRHSHDQIQRILFEKSSSFTDFSNSFDYSSFSLFTLDKYFDELFPIFIDCFLNPRWDEAEFEKTVNDMKIKRQQDLTDPLGLAADKLHQVFFKGHPYEAPFGGTEESLSRIVLQDVRQYYADYFSPGRMVVTAVGNFDPDDLFLKLNATLGRLPKKPIRLPAVPPFARTKASLLILEPFPASAGVAYVRADTYIPQASREDYPALLIACSMLDDIFYQKIRIEHGAAYGMWAYPFSFRENYLSITVFKTAVPEKVKQYVDDSIAVMVKGKCLGAAVSASAEAVEKSQGAENPPAVYVDLAEALAFYKARYINEYYQKQESNSSIASQILTSLVYAGDYRDYLFLIDRINRVTAADIERVTKTYLYAQPKMWIVVGSQDLLDKIKRDDYLRFLGEVR